MTRGKKKPIFAAGAVVFRVIDGIRHVLVVHRPRYDDWSLPKGKQAPDEYLPVTAVREVGEESGYRISLSGKITTVNYRVHGRQKYVHWWEGHLLNEVQGHIDPEVDAVEWWPVDKAIAHLDIPSDVDVLISAIRRRHRPLFFIARHTKAMPRKSWNGIDADRRLTERGRRQAKALIDLLSAFHIGHLNSSTSSRCTLTLKPYARRIATDICRYHQLSEESAAINPSGVAQAMEVMIDMALKQRHPTIVCGHRPVLPAMFDYLGIECNHTLKPGEVAVVEIEQHKAISTYYIPPLI